MAIHFYNPEKHFFISTNFKVWYSTLEKQKCLKRVTSEIVLRNIISTPRKYIPKHFLLVRNPYARVESFYRDKFIKHPKFVKVHSNHKWQNCQKIFFPLININAQTDHFQIRKALLSVSFKEFISHLPEVYKLDGHLIPQYFAYFTYNNNQVLQIPYSRIIKVEEAEDITFLKKKLEIDINIKENYTGNIECDMLWGKAEKETMKKLYKDDFKLFNYNY